MTKFNQREYQTVILGALLHDIGKFMQRAEVEREIPEIKTYYDEFCPLSKAGHFSHLHAAHTAYFIKHLIPERLFDKTELYNAARHHKNSPDDIYIQADWLSSDMERYEDEAEREDYKNVLLHSIFDLVELQYKIKDDDGRLNSRWYYEKKPIKSDEIQNIFPVFSEDIDALNNIKVYKSLWDEFKEEVEEIKDIKDWRKYFNELYYLLEKYTWCVPSATNVFPDISLFDHLKTTAAIAGVLYHKQKESSSKEEPDFILYGGDISGIQDYIFRISEAQGIGGIAKRLRGRSFCISMLSEVLARYIISELGYPQTNINFCGGGNFEILLANTGETKEFLTDLEKDINKYLIEEYYGILAFVGSYITISKDEVRREFNRCKERLEAEIAIAKLHKFNTHLDDDKFWLDDSTIEGKITVCPSCNLKLIRKGTEDICWLCAQDKRIGEKLPRAGYLTFSFGAESDISFGRFGNVGLHELISNREVYDYIYGISNSVSDIKAKFPLAKSLPYATERIDSLETEEDETGESTVHKDQTLSFATLADMSDGDKKLGVLKMDVDNLGLAFTTGLVDVQGKHLKTISRISTLSRGLSYYFTFVVDSLCKKVFEGWKSATSWPHKDKASNIFYLTFSGGDDLFIAGPWDRIIELAIKIRQSFKRYTCQNPNLAISAGIFICKPKFPISIAARKAEEALTEAKNKGKNRITVFGETAVWDIEDKDSRIFQDELRDKYEIFTERELKEEGVYINGSDTTSQQKTLTFSELMDFAELLENTYEEDTLSRRFIYRLLEINNLCFQSNYNDKKDGMEEIRNMMFFPYLFYNIERNVKAEVKEILKEKLITGGDAESYVRQIKIPCKYVMMKTRR